MSTAGNIQGVQWVPGIPDLIVNWSNDLKLYKISVVPREYKASEIVDEYIVNCPALKSELKHRITGTYYCIFETFEKLIHLFLYRIPTLHQMCWCQPSCWTSPYELF